MIDLYKLYESFKDKPLDGLTVDMFAYTNSPSRITAEYRGDVARLRTTGETEYAQDGGKQ